MSVNREGSNPSSPKITTLNDAAMAELGYALDLNSNGH